MTPQNTVAKKYINKIEDRIVKQLTKGMKKMKYYESKGRYIEAYNLSLKLHKLASNNKEISNLMNKYRRNLRNIAKKYTDKGIAAYEAGNYSLAQKYFRNLLSIEPNNKTANRYLDLIKNKISKKDANKLYFLGIEAYTNNDYKKALYYWEEVKRIYPDYPNLKSNIIRARKKLRDIKK